ncbi:hypothetical protein B0H13DRAFT_2373675 [Mycena leptocephala]|nr:hypothetical protein B0H13DRAFT_2373675 [Mycena leptocephala]
MQFQPPAYLPVDAPYPVNAPDPALFNVYRAPLPLPMLPPPLNVSAPKEPRKRQAKDKDKESEPKYSACNLLDIVQTALAVQIFTAKHGEKNKKLAEFATAVHKLGIEGSDGVLKARLLEVLAYHEEPASTLAAIVKAISGSGYEITLGAPLDQLAAQRREYEGKTDTQKDKMLKKAAEDKTGSKAIRNVSLNRSRRAAETRMAKESDDEVVVVTSPLRHSKPTPPHLADLLDYKPDSGDESDGIEIIAHHRPTPDINSNCAVVKSDPVSATVPKKGVKTETPFPSIPRMLRKSAAKKHKKEDDSDVENSPPSTARKSKRVHRNESFDVKAFLLEEHKTHQEFQTSLLCQVRQGNAQFHQVAENTQTFQSEFLGILRGVFPAPN